jgi:amidohydrolase
MVADTSSYPLRTSQYHAFMERAFVEDLPSLLSRTYEPMVEIRRDLHAHPELAFQENRTTHVIRDRLSELGWELADCPTETGAVAVLHGAKPGKRVMLRADIDGLPVHEERDLSYASLNDGVMHACGHDVHTASLLGAADLLRQRQDELAGEFTLIFQPAEEGLSGAQAMIDGGVLENHPADFVIGAHVTSVLPLGFMATRPGVMMSQANAITIDIKGKGGHGAMSTVEGNVVLAVSALAPRLGEVVIGLDYEGGICACSAGVINAGTANNVVPRHALLRGTLRTFTPDQYVEAMARLELILREIEEHFGVHCSLSLGDATPAVVNNASVAQRVIKTASEIVGAANVLDLPPVSPSDDMSEFLNRIPGCYMFVGGALADGTSGQHHSPDFAVDDESCRNFASVLASCAVELAQI